MTVSPGPVLLDCETMTPARPIQVVCAIIEDSTGRLLLAQRPAHKHLGLKWEFAGGKVEPGESPAAALVREIKEELGCDIEVRRALPPFTHDYGSVRIEMLPFVCELTASSSPPQPHEHLAVQWFALAEIADVDLAPADWPVVAMLRDAVQR
jgi:8-oxo-dGTP diphosphatase